MNRDNIVFAICGLLLGLIIGSLVIGPRIARSRLAGGATVDSTPVATPPVSMAGTDTTGGGSVVMPSAASEAAGANPMQSVLQQLGALKAEVAKNPNNAEALVQLGNLYMDAAKFPQAVEYYERAIAVHDDAGVRTDLGICYRKLGKLDKALAAFIAARTLDPKQWQASFNEAIVLVDLHRTAEAHQVVDALVKSRPGDADVIKLQQMVNGAK